LKRIWIVLVIVGLFLLTFLLATLIQAATTLE